MEFTVRLRTRARAEVVAEGRQGTEGWGLSQKVSGGPQLLRAPREACCLLHSWSLLLSPRQACQLIPAQHLARSFHFLWPAWDLSHLSTYWRGFLVPWVGQDMKESIFYLPIFCTFCCFFFQPNVASPLLLWFAF